LNQVSDKESIVGGFFDKDEVSKNLKAVEVDQLKKILADRKKDIIKNLIEGLIEKASVTLESHIESECSKKEIKLVYKDLDEGFVNELPGIDNAKKMADA
ncbi:MAG: hypothetical protein ABIA74_03275, partial [bacterium]